jgi:hypothetical protein
MSQYVAPSRNSDDYNCPHCGVYAHQRPLHVRYVVGNQIVEPTDTETEMARVCHHCGKRTLWDGEKMILPIGSGAPLPNDDMPEDCKIDYLEARQIANLSPRGAAALLRLALQKMCVHLGEPGKDINTDIGSLVKKGLRPQLQQALDSVRVIGNEAVHPGRLDLRDDPQLAQTLFALVNLIVQTMISDLKAVDAFYSQLPASKLQGIENRDKPKST